jgi:hypothetical protein
MKDGAMTRLLMLAASLGLAISQAAACNFERSASKVDDTKVASISTDQAAKAQNMSVPVSQPTQSTIVLKKQAAPADQTN